MADPWIVTPPERSKHEEQFKTLNPSGGFITGEQAKGFFLQSRLPPQVLGIIWALSDINGDGKMDIYEFSIACKLINLKLRHFNLPSALPDSLKQSACRETSGLNDLVFSDMSQASTVNTSCTATNIVSGMAHPNVTSLPMGTETAFVASNMPCSATPAYGSPLINTSSIPAVAARLSASVSDVMSTPGPITATGFSEQCVATVVQPVRPVQPVSAVSGIGAPLNVVGIAQPHISTMPQQIHPVRPFVPISGYGVQTTIATTSNVVNSVVPPPQPPQEAEWAIPQASRLKFTQVFNMTDHSKSGYISGVQARNIIIQSQLPQHILAQIWALSDLDNDGRLSCDEFVLALYLCEQAKLGAKVPTVIPLELIPPIYRRQRKTSVQSSGSVGTPGTDGSLVATPTSAGPLDTSFEDKRRENYEKGQAELERRRKALLDAQRRETEERLRKEREEESKREKARQEAERRRQEQLEEEMQRQREIEAQRESERKRQEELKEEARKEAERQRQLEWEKQRLQELMNVRQRQQENLLALKAKNQSLSVEISTKEERLKELTEKISETRSGVTEVKAFIDNMRSTRDNYMSEMNNLKASARDQNERLLALNQEKARLRARSLATAAVSGMETAAVDATVANKQVVIKQLQEKFDELQEMVLKLREKLVNPDAAWGDAAGSTWAGKMKDSFSPSREDSDAWPACQINTALTDSSRPSAAASFSPSLQQAAMPPARPPLPAASLTGPVISGNALDKAEVEDKILKYRALYQFEARNADELSFMPGDIILISSSEGAEPGWLGGELNDKTGWFPEAYCEKIEEDAANGLVENLKQPFENISETDKIASSELKKLGEGYVIFSWSPKFENQLLLEKGANIIIRAKQDEWLFVECEEKFGWFPSNFIKITSGSFRTSIAGSPTETPCEPAPSDILSHDQLSEFCRTVYPYDSEEPGDLVFNADEEMLVVKKDGDWWYGIIDESRAGVFPSNYVHVLNVQFEPKTDGDVIDGIPVQEEIVCEVEKEQTLEKTAIMEDKSQVEKTEVSNEVITQEIVQAEADVENKDDVDAENKEVAELTKSPKSPKKGRKPEIAVVIAPYDAASSNQLSLRPKQIVLIRKKTKSGWWEGQLQVKGKKRQIGWFPASYVKIKTGSSRSTPVSMELSNIEDIPPPDVVAESLSQQTNFIPQVVKARDPLGKVQAIYSYTAMNDDELTFSAGDIILVVDKEDAAWWKGVLNGVSGVFPSNYVQLLEGCAELTGAVEENSDSLCYNGNNRNAENRYSCIFSPQSATEQQRQNVVYELIQTESVYLSELILVQQVFIAPMLSSQIVSQKDTDCIFVNWDELIQVSSNFDKALKIRKANYAEGAVTMIADVLCQQLLKYTPNNHPDFQNTMEAKSVAETLCAQVNEAMSQKENTDKLEWMQSHVICEGLQERLIFNSLTNTLGPRKLLHMGILHKMKSKRELVAFLLSDFLLLTTPSKILNCPTTLAALERALTNITCYMYRKPMFLSELQTQLLKDSDVAFVLTCEQAGGEIHLQVCAQSSNDRNNWMKKMALAKKHLIDTEKSVLRRQQSEENDISIVGRLLLCVLSGANLSVNSSDVRARPAKGVLSMSVANAKNLQAWGKVALHSFCEVSLGSQVDRTSVALSPHPRWDSAMQFYIKSLSEDVLCITVYEKGFFKPNEFLGRVEVRIQHLWKELDGKRDPLIIPLRLQEVMTGEVMLKVSIQLFERL